jgi:hypothetical protein
LYAPIDLFSVATQEAGHIYVDDQAAQTRHDYQYMEGAQDVPHCMAAFCEIDVDVDFADKKKALVLHHEFKLAMGDDTRVIRTV